jgi:hypothetical protein
MTSGLVATTERATETAYSFISTVISSGVARIGAVVSVVALSTLPLVPAVVGGAASSSQLNTPTPVVDVQETVPKRPLERVDDTSRDGREPSVDHADADNPTPSVSGAIESPQPSGSPLDGDATESASPPVEGLAEVPGVTTPDLVEDVVEPLVEDTVGVLVDDVAEPLVEVVVEVVEDTVELVVEDTVEPLVDDVVELVVDDVVEPLVDDLSDVLDDVVPGLGGFLGGR